MIFCRVADWLDLIHLISYAGRKNVRKGSETRSINEKTQFFHQILH